MMKNICDYQCKKYLVMYTETIYSMKMLSISFYIVWIYSKYPLSQNWITQLTINLNQTIFRYQRVINMHDRDI